MPSRGTPQTQIRFTAEEKAWIKVIQEYYGIPTVSEAVRKAVGVMAAGLIRPGERKPKKSGKGS